MLAFFSVATFFPASSNQISKSDVPQQSLIDTRERGREREEAGSVLISAEKEFKISTLSILGSTKRGLGLQDLRKEKTLLLLLFSDFRPLSWTFK
jgi:hypothetical protein